MPLGDQLRQMRLRKKAADPSFTVASIIKKVGIAPRTLYAYEEGSSAVGPRNLGLLLDLYEATAEERAAAFAAHVNPENTSCS